MKAFLYDDDPRRGVDADYPINKGSFAVIIDNLNTQLGRLKMLGDHETADWVGFASSLKFNFGFQNKKRFLISVWECDELPAGFLRWKLQSDTVLIGLSAQVADLWAKSDVKIPVVDIGVDMRYFKANSAIPKNEKFTILSVTALNFRSGINHLLTAFAEFSKDKKDKVKLIVKNTDERAVQIPRLCHHLSSLGFDIEYIGERLTIDKIRELYYKSHLLAYNVGYSSAGLPILEAAAMKLPCITTDSSPMNIYPHSEAVSCKPITINDANKILVGEWGLPYTFPAGIIDENRAHINWLDDADFVAKLQKIYDNYQFYLDKAEENHIIVKKRWQWSNSCSQLIEILDKHDEKT